MIWLGYVGLPLVVEFDKKTRVIGFSLINDGTGKYVVEQTVNRYSGGEF